MVCQLCSLCMETVEVNYVDNVYTRSYGSQIMVVN